MTITKTGDTLRDERNNTASIEYWGSEDVARKALESLTGCSRCSDCSDCSDCSGCYGCYGCSRCYDCSDCSDCYGCSGCSDCYGCSGCSRCSGCYGCSGCSRCSDCSDCSDLAPQKSPMAVPVIPNIHQAVYAAVSQPNAFDMADWHKCETTHCRGGWIVTLAGESGKQLEKQTSTLFAAMQIYKASGYEISPCRFFDSNDEAMADMKRLAGVE